MAMNKQEVEVVNELLNRVDKLYQILYSYQIVLASMPKIVTRKMESGKKFTIPKQLRRIEIAPQYTEWMEDERTGTDHG